MSALLKALSTRILLCDGAMGTQLQRAGLAAGECGESWNLAHPDKVLAIQSGYVEAGADCLTTNSFGACRLALDRHDLADQTREINVRAVEIARRAFGSRPGFVLGDLGPFGGLMEPYGTVGPDEVRRAFREQARALVEGGVDAVLVETQSALEELEIAVREAKDAGAPCVIASMAFNLTPDGRDTRTMMGVTPEQAARRMREAGADVAGMNCGSGVDFRNAAAILERFRSVCDFPLIAQPNAGQPILEGGQTVYRGDPEMFAAPVAEAIAAGARVVGACCGSSPDHIRALRTVLDRLQACG